MTADPIQIRRRTPLPVMAHAVHPYFSGLSLRRAAKSLRHIISRSHVSIWRWVQRLGPILGSFGADPRDVRRIFVDEIMVNVGGTSALIRIAFEPDLRAMLDFRVSRRGNSIDAYLSSGGPRISTAGSRSTLMVRDGTPTPADGPAWSM